MGITIKELADLAGVSRGTVDRALNDRGQVSESARKKILKLAHDYGYKKNVIASRLAKNETKTIAVILPAENQDPYWAVHYNAIQRSTKTFRDFGVKIKNYPFDINSAESYAKVFAQAIVDQPNGILVAPLFYKQSHHYFNIVIQNEIPLVCINSDIGRLDEFGYIGQDSVECGRLAARLFSLSNHSNPKIIVLTLGHESNNATHIKLKIEGLESYNHDYRTNFEIIPWQIKDYGNVENLQKQCKEIISSHDDINGVFFTNSRAHLFLNHTDFYTRLPSQATIIGFDLIPPNNALLKDGKIDFLLNQSPHQQSHLGLAALFDNFVHGRSTKHTQYLPTDVVLKENLDNYLASIDRHQHTLG